jgi:hypothetical protein
MRYLTFAFVVLCIAYPKFLSANEFQSELEALANNRVLALASAPEVISALIEQNQAHAGLDQDGIDKLDKAWRSEVTSIDQPTIDAVMDNPLSRFLIAQQDASGGLFTEIIVMDARGLNVGQSELTTDLWQGDEDKWTQTFGKGPGALHISDIVQDESTQVVQSQISVPVVDPGTGKPIGAVTVGVNIERL